LALLAAVSLGGAGGYAIGTATSAPAMAQVTTTASDTQLGPASRWTHEERPAIDEQPARASRWDHEEQTTSFEQFGPASRWTHEERP